MEKPIRKQVDALGRIEIPVELREAFGLQTEDPIEISIDNGKVVIRKLDQPCPCTPPAKT